MATRNRDEVREFIDGVHKKGASRDELLVAIMEQYKVSLSTASLYLREYSLLRQVTEKKKVIEANTKLTDVVVPDNPEIVDTPQS